MARSPAEQRDRTIARARAGAQDIGALVVLSYVEALEAQGLPVPDSLPSIAEMTAFVVERAVRDELATHRVHTSVLSDTITLTGVL